MINSSAMLFCKTNELTLISSPKYQLNHRAHVITGLPYYGAAITTGSTLMTHQRHMRLADKKKSVKNIYKRCAKSGKKHVLFRQMKAAKEALKSLRTKT